MHSNGRRVVMTGLGPVTPIGIGKDQCWESLRVGRSGTRRVTDYDHLALKSRVMGVVEGFDPGRCGLTPSQIRRMDRNTQLAVVAADMAIADSRLDLAQEDPDRIGINVANAVAGTRFMDEEFVVVTENGNRPVDPEDASPYSYTKSLPNSPSNEIAARYGMRGICTTSATGCTGGIDAVGFATDHIRDGFAEVMIAGAAEAPITPITIAAFDAIGAITTRNEDPEKASRPFDASRDAFVLAEGAGIVVLEELEHARRRGATIYAEIAGFASVSNAFHMTGLGGPAKGHLARAIRMAMEEAGVGPEEVDYINAHGSGTTQNDICETEAFKMVFGDAARRIPISSTKSMTGHALAAASAMELAFCGLVFQNDFLPPTINLDRPAVECDLDYVPNKGRALRVNTIVKDASGFSGLHSAMVLKRYSA